MKKSSDFLGCTPEAIWEIERRLSQPTFRGVPVGSALAAVLYIDIWSGDGNWNLKNNLKNRARFFYHHLWHLRMRRQWKSDVGFCRGRLLVTWLGLDFRCTDLIFPVIRHLGYDRCVMLYPDPEMAEHLPQGAVGLDVQQATGYDVGAWLRDYLGCWKALRPVVKQIVRDFSFPYGVYLRLADAVVTCTQLIAGCLEFLRRSCVSAVLTEYDRNDMSASLVLAARTLGIPTFTLMHGVHNDNCLGFYPLLADKLFCWGEDSAKMFMAAGLAPGRIEIGGCPRLTRDLPMSAAEARAKIGLDPDMPVVMLATSNFNSKWRLRIAETFCEAVERIEAVSGVVRLHPKDEMQLYSELVARFPAIKFMVNEECTLDVALAATDIVVTYLSGVGSDALVKRRLTVILDVLNEPLGYGGQLVELAGCPQATSSENLWDILRSLLNDAEERNKRQRLAEAYVGKFCAYFGDESAARISECVLKEIGGSRP
jgi:hypothetical protein